MCEIVLPKGTPQSMSAFAAPSILPPNDSRLLLVSRSACAVTFPLTSVQKEQYAELHMMESGDVTNERNLYQVKKPQ